MLSIRPLVFLALLSLPGCAMFEPHCVPVGAWVSPETKAVIGSPLPADAYRAVVLLGESHDSAPDHRWQYDSIAALYDVNPNMALGFEMFPRAVQPQLDQWVRGDYADEQAFLDAVNWKKIWGIDPALYMPIFKFARDHKLPMMALNVNRDLVKRVGKEGWAAIDPKDREGVGDPAPATAAYRARLKEVMSGHSQPALKDEQIDRFVAAQQLWDRAMAEGIAKAHRGASHPTVVGIMGEGHVANRDGVAYQLAALGIDDTAALLPWNPDEDSCREDLQPGLADAVFGTAAEPKKK